MNKQLKLGESILLPATVSCKPAMAAYRVTKKMTGGHVLLEAESHLTEPRTRVIHRAASSRRRAKAAAYKAVA